MIGLIVASPAETLPDWPLWPKDPHLNIVFQKYITPYEPLAFTTIGENRGFLTWVVVHENPYPKTGGIYTYNEAWGGELFISDLALSGGVKSSQSEPCSFFTGEEKVMFDGSTFLDLNSDTVDMADWKGYLLPNYVAAGWTAVNPEGSSADIANEYFSPAVSLEWHDFLTGNVKGHPGDPGLFKIADSGHSSPVASLVDDYWVAGMDGFSAFRTYLAGRYAVEHWGDAIIYLQSNEGWIHAIGTEKGINYFRGKWSIMPMPSFIFSPFQADYKKHNGYFPHLTLLDGPINVGDIELDDTPGVWRRVLYGSTGLGVDLIAKPDAVVGDNDDIWDYETGLQVDTISGDRPDVKGHAFGLYALDVAQQSDSISPANPKMLWSVCNTYWGSDAGKLFVGKGAYDASSAPSEYRGYMDLKASVARPITGFVTQTGGGRRWKELLLGIGRNNYFNIYAINANTGAVGTEDVFPLICATDFGNDGDSKTVPYWDIDYESAFPSRIAAVATNDFNGPYGSSKLSLQTEANLREVYVHLSNGDLYLINPQEMHDNPPSYSPILLAEMYYNLNFSKTKLPDLYNGDYKNTLLGAASMQDLDATYMLTAEGEDSGERKYHRFLALVIKVGTRFFDPDGTLSDETSDDMRMLVVLDITNILNKETAAGRHLVLDPATWSRGNDTAIFPLVGDDYTYGWMMYLAGGLARNSKYWQEDIAISSPIFYCGRLILATYEPQSSASHIFVLPITKENMDEMANDSLEARLKQVGIDYSLVVDDPETDEHEGVLIAYDNVKFAGGAAMDDSGNIYVGAISDGSYTTLSENLGDMLPDEFSPKNSYNGHGDTIYWKVIK